MAVGLTQKWKGENCCVKDNAESVEDAKVGYEAGEGALETKVSGKKNTQSGNISCN